MKKNGILNKDLMDAITGMGHGDIMMIVDAGFPIPDTGVRRIDLAIAKDYPESTKVLELILQEFIYEKCIVADEQKKYNPYLFNKIEGLIDRCPVETVLHSKIIEEYSKKARVMVRTGSFEPWGNIILYSGIDAHVWFQKDGAVTPDYYEERASYKGK